MIVPMKRVNLVVLESMRREALAQLRRLGVVHIEPASGTSPELESRQERQAIIARALGVLATETKPPKAAGAGSIPVEEAVALAGALITTAEELRAAREDRERFAREADRLAVWGEFSPTDLEALGRAGVAVRLYEIAPDKLKDLDGDADRFVVYRTKKAVGVAVVSTSGEGFPSGLDPTPLPQRSLAEVRRLVADREGRIRELVASIEGRAAQAPLLAAAAGEAAAEVEFEAAAAGMGLEGPVAYLVGWVPEPKAVELKAAGAKGSWGLLVRDPAEGEAVPTLVDNPRWIRIIQPVFDLLGVTPGYKEVDISFVFLSFFIIFVAMIIGDAGYGAVFLSLAVYFGIKEKQSLGRLGNGTILLILLNIATLVWGAVTGVWFGSSTLNRHPALSWMVIPWLDGFNDENALLIKQVTFVIGVTHLTVAHLWNFIRALADRPRIKALAQLGWLAMIWGLYFFVLNLVLDSRKFPIPEWAPPLVLAGLAAIFVFGKQEGHFLKGVVAGLADFIPTALGSVSAFADIISYIRLFAVGLATIEIAKSFNAMAAGLAGAGPVGIVALVLILIVGHGLNMAMAALAVIVHGVRLNMLEFSQHVGLEWAGNPYRPFKD